MDGITPKERHIMAKTKETKAPVSITIKVLAPYAIIALTAVAAAGFITGWHAQSNQQQHIEAKANAIVKSLASQQ